MAAPLDSPCLDCGAHTTPCTGKRGCRHIGRWEHYMVLPEVWAAARMGKGYLCIGCLERRLGRRLQPEDFSGLPINESDNPWNTPRLASRLELV